MSDDGSDDDDDDDDDEVKGLFRIFWTMTRVSDEEPSSPDGRTNPTVSPSSSLSFEKSKAIHSKNAEKKDHQNKKGRRKRKEKIKKKVKKRKQLSIHVVNTNKLEKITSFLFFLLFYFLFSLLCFFYYLKSFKNSSISRAITSPPIPVTIAIPRSHHIRPLNNRNGRFSFLVMFLSVIPRVRVPVCKMCYLATLANVGVVGVYEFHFK